MRKTALSKEIAMFNIGEKPRKGTYCCTNCGQQVRVDDDDDRLPRVRIAEGTVQALLTSND